MKKKLHGSKTVLWVSCFALIAFTAVGGGYIAFEKGDGEREIIFKAEQIEDVYLEIFRTDNTTRRAVLLRAISQISDANATLVLYCFLGDSSEVLSNSVSYKGVEQLGQVRDYAVRGLDRRYKTALLVNEHESGKISDAHRVQWISHYQIGAKKALKHPNGESVFQSDTNELQKIRLIMARLLSLKKQDEVIAEIQKLSDSDKIEAAIVLGFLLFDNSKLTNSSEAIRTSSMAECAAHGLNRLYKSPYGERVDTESLDKWRQWFRSEGKAAFSDVAVDSK